MKTRRIKKLFALLLVVCLLVSCLPLSASAATNPYKQYQQIKGVKSVRCTWVAWKYAYEQAGVALPHWAVNANGWYGKAKSAGFKMYGKNDIPPAKSIMCWGGEYGHVAYVSSADSKGATIVENSGRTWKSKYKTWSELKNRGGGSADGDLTLQGCFALGTVQPSSSFSTTVKDVTQTSATLDTNITASAIPSESGVYFGTSSGNLKKLSSDGASKSTTPHVWYSTSKYYGKLTAGTTYYYQFYTVVKGKTIWDSKRSFTTLQGENKAKASFDSSAKDITKTSATMHAYVTASAVPSSGGMYFGTSTSNLKLLGSDTGLKSKTPHLWYATSKYYGALKPGVTYYYRPYVVISGATVWGDIKTFQTAKCTNHVKGSFRFYEAVHPHKNYFTCSVCGESFTDGSTSKMDSCTTCNPPRIKITLYYDDQGLSDYMDSESKSGTSASQTFSITKSKPIMDGYDFLGWSKSSTATTAEYQAGDSITIDKDTILYGVWKKISGFKLSYYYYSGSTKNGYEEKASEELPCRFIVRSPEEERKGYIFKGWSWNKNSTIPEYQPGDIVEIEESRTLYAVWESDGSISFEDVTVGEYYYDAVDWAVENKITSGTSETTFSPNQACTRGQAVTFLWNSAGKPEPQGNGNQFIDVKTDSYYEKAVQWAVEEGITSGTGEGKFSPDSKCTRGQIVTFLYRAEGKPQVLAEDSFSDVKAGDYYEIPVQWAAQNGITSGTGGGKFSPEQSCTRGQIVTFLYRNIA